DAIPYTVAPLRTDVAHMTSSLAAISNNWAINIALFWGSIRVPANTLNIKVCADQHNWDTFYLLLWEILQGETTNRLDMQKVRDQLNAAPCKGPYAESATVFSGNGWACSAKFWHEKKIQQEGDVNFLGMYNGLDYMLLYNLYRIQNPGISPAYKNYHHPYLTGNVTAPESYIAMCSIRSEQVITTQAQAVEYRAGENIELLPGFGTGTGVDFTAYIEPVDCDENVFGNEAGKQSTYTRTITEDTLGYFTFECIPEIGDTLIFNGMDSDTANIFSYSWYFPSPAQILSGQSTRNPVVIFPVCNYNYELCSMAFTDSIGETNRVFFNIYKECCDSLELKNGTAPVNAYPNPNDGLFRLNSTETGVNYILEVYNIFGELVYTGTSANGEAIINIKGTAPGLYMIKLFIDDGREQVLKILIK
ncbi:MAG TPA: T9SS type A sorting domain-containing protein, partial [Bacteroidales bacterium]|nr:T9SS type A sorting domain-containing protein [Bacteroidales bacterium]